jgi:signal transduction histidine kinase
VSTLRGQRLPGPDDVPALVEQARTAGHPVTFEVTGTSRPVPAGTALALYRGVQEALTNATKHAGTGAAVAVRIDWGPDAVRADVTDDGNGGAPLPPLPSGGYGLAGLGERAALAGGKLDAGPCGNGWRVRLTLPLLEAGAGEGRS